MTDRELIITNFVEKYYDVGSVINYNNSEIPFGIASKEDWNENEFKRGDKDYPGPSAFVNLVTDLYSDFMTDEGVYLSEMVHKWYNDKYDAIVKDIMIYLNTKVNIILGPRNWQPVVDGKPWMWKALIDLFDEQYSDKTIKLVYDRWYQKKVEEISEKAMNEPYF